MYGTGGGAWDIANTAITGDVMFSQTFIPTTTANLTGFRGYLEDEDGGYGAGTGGVLHFEIQTDDGHGFASGIKVGTGSADVFHPRPNNLIFALHTFNSSVPVKAGTKYHLVNWNTDKDPDENYVSTNDIYKGTGPIAANSCNVKNDNGVWRQRRNDGFTYIPIGEYHYDNGVVDGFGYVHAMSHNQHKCEISSTNGVRELITVSGGDKPVGDLHFYAEYISGGNVIVATLKSPGRKEVKRLSTSASTPDTQSGQWYTIPFDVTLIDGVSYTLEFFAEGDGLHKAIIFRNGESYGYSPQSEFADGYAQYYSSSDGIWSNWVIWGSPGTEGDLMFYFDLE